jgi:hypothetical protein
MLMHDRCTVCAEHAIGSEIVLHAPMKLLCHVVHVESHFSAFGDSANLDVR